MAALTPQEQDALQRFKRELLRRFPGEIRQVVLFGSKARGDARPDSDIDVLVVTQQSDWRLGDRIQGLVTDMLLETGVDLSVKVFGQPAVEQLQRYGGGFIVNALHEGAVV